MQGLGENYHSHEMTSDRADEIVNKVVADTRFEIDETLAEERIYVEGKIVSRKFKGRGLIEGEMREAVLEVQFLRRDIEKAVLMREFKDQNESETIRVADVFDHATYQQEEGYGYMIMEHVQGRPIFRGSEEDMTAWIAFYEEFKSKALRTPLFPQEEVESEASKVTRSRLDHWLSISEKQGHLDEGKKILADDHIRQMQAKGVTQTEFTHGLLTGKNVLVDSEGKTVIMNHDHWKNLPKGSDTAYITWDYLKELRRDQILTPEAAIEYTEKWRAAYKTIPFIAQDPNFDLYFASAIRERCLGALIVDIDSDLRNRKKNADGTPNMTAEEAERLKFMFVGLYNHYSKNIK